MPPFYLPILPGTNMPAGIGEWITEGELFSDIGTLVTEIKEARIEPLPVRIVRVDLKAGTSSDVTQEVAEEIAKDCDDPFDDLAKWLDRLGVEWRDPYADDYDQRREHGTLSRQMQL